MKPTFQSFRPTKGKIFVTDLERGMSKTAGGIIMTDDNMTNRGIRSRWGKVVFVGADDNNGLDGIAVGDWILVEHGRWSMGIDLLDADTGETVTIWHIDNKAMLVVCDEDPRPAQYKL
jgi:co-chaperonin GroES (HSP10)